MKEYNSNNYTVCFGEIQSLKDLLEHVDHRNVIDFIKETYFYNELYYLLYIFYRS